MDSIEECSQCSDPSMMYTSVSCIVAMLTTLQELSTGKGVTTKYLDKINALYPNLKHCDYKGLLSSLNLLDLGICSISYFKYSLLGESDNNMHGNSLVEQTLVEQ